MKRTVRGRLKLRPIGRFLILAPKFPAGLQPSAASSFIRTFLFFLLRPVYQLPLPSAVLRVEFPALEFIRRRPELLG